MKLIEVNIGKLSKNKTILFFLTFISKDKLVTPNFSELMKKGKNVTLR